MITWITYHDGTEPFKTMAHELGRSINEVGAGKVTVFEVLPNGGHYLIEFYGAMYPVFSQAIQHGPVVIIDSDCIVKKPIDDLFEKDFTLGAIYRGSCANSMGKHDFLGSFLGFNSLHPGAARRLWMRWIALVFDYLEKPVVPAAIRRRENIEAKGWHSNWYGGQAAYNEILFEEEEKNPGSVLRLDRNMYAARSGTEEACVWHQKGERKMV